MDRKLVLVVVDSLRADMLQAAVRRDVAPTFAELLRRGEFVPDCVSSFPTVTPVCCAEIATGEGPGHHGVSGMNWYHRAERRYVEYGTSLEATRRFGLFRTLYDIVYNMNMSHLSHEVSTVFEHLGDAGARTACTPFLIYRGRTRHELGLEGMLRRVAVAASFRHAVWGPDELFYGELYASRRVPCRPTLARPGTRDAYSACVGRELVREDLFDFLLFSLPDNDHRSHRLGPDAMPDSIAWADACLAEIVDEAGGLDAFCDSHSVIVTADHAQTRVEHRLRLTEILAEDWHVLGPNDEQPKNSQVAVSPTGRAAGIYLIDEPERALRDHPRIRGTLSAADGVDLVAWLGTGDGPLVRSSPEPLHEASRALEAVVLSGSHELRFRPGSQVRDRRGRHWDIEGDLAVLAAGIHEGELRSDAYPDPLGRLWSGLTATHAPDLLISLQAGWECVDWGGIDHVGGGSHGSLAAGDSLVPLLQVGLEPSATPPGGQWKLCDLAGLIDSHFGIASRPGQGVPTAEVVR